MSTRYHSRANRSQSIERRIIDGMIYIVHTRGWKPKAIYLTPEDMDALKEARHRESIDGIPVRLGKTSMVYGHAWHGRAI